MTNMSDNDLIALITYALAQWDMNVSEQAVRNVLRNWKAGV